MEFRVYAAVFSSRLKADVQTIEHASLAVGLLTSLRAILKLCYDSPSF
jgi:hypothetical protein